MAGGDLISKTFRVSEDTHYRRLDRFLRKCLPEYKLSSIYKLIRKSFVRVNGITERDPATELFVGDVVVIAIEADADHMKRLEETRELLPSSIPLSILYEDDHMLAIDKPPGLSVHPGKGIQIVTLIEGLMSYGERKGFRPRLVHRLDKHTSGVLIVAKTPASARHLTEMFRKRNVKKKYLCLVKGIAIADKGRLQDKTAGVQEEMEYSVMKRFADCSLIEVALITGRKHQIRRQLAQLGFPVVCDNVYGDRDYNQHFRKSRGLRRYFLHCAEVVVEHPVNAKETKISAPIPRDLSSVLERLQ